jgi:RNA polymerase sigma-70 factor (ECF subfamily)
LAATDAIAAVTVGAGGLTDAAIIGRSDRTPDIFGVLYDRYAGQLHRFAYRRLGPEAAEDVVADTFLAAFRRRGSYDPARPDARPWLFGILTREIARYHRAEERRYRALARLTPVGPTDGQDDRVTAAVTARAARARLAEALRRLPAADRDTLLLHAWAQLSYEEIAETLAIPVGTVRSRLHRARRTLRDAFGGRDPMSLSEEQDV